MSTAYLLWAVVFSTVGLGFFIDGKKQKMITPLICGVTLMIFPYFILNTMILVVTGIVLMAVPYFIKF